MQLPHIALFAAVMVVAWVVALHAWPRLLLSVFKRAVLVRGFPGGGPIPLNSLEVQSQEFFADPLSTAPGSRLMTTGVNRDTLLLAGWLRLGRDGLLLEVPDAGDRYYSVQFTDPATNAAAAYVGTRATGNRAGDYLITGPRWTAALPPGATRISLPRGSALVIGRVLVYTDDLELAHDFASRIRLTSWPG